MSTPQLEQDRAETAPAGGPERPAPPYRWPLIVAALVAAIGLGAVIGRSWLASDEPAEPAASPTAGPVGDDPATTPTAPDPAVDAAAGPVQAGPAIRTLTSADGQALAAGFTVPAGEVWELDPNQSVELVVSGNIVVEGVLRARPASPDLTHLVRFAGVDETRFVGDGMDLLDTDVGIWVVGAGQLDVQGHQRTGWVRLAGPAAAGDIVLTLDRAPANWAVGDAIAVAPTASPDTRGFASAFDEATVVAIDGATVTLDQPLAADHPLVDGTWSAEVMNLTRNVRFEGTETTGAAPSTDGRAHLFIRSERPQNLRHLQIRWFGPRRPFDEFTDGVPGRYSMHFHHNGDGSRGSLVEGVVVRDSGNSAFVPHASNGITMRDNIAYQGFENAFWWDPPGGQFATIEPADEDRSQDTADLIWDHNIVAGLSDDPDFQGYRLAGFTMATGQNLTITDSVAVGVAGNESSSGFNWPEPNSHHPFNTWTFTGNVAHNNRVDGIFVWQNDENVHIVDGFVGYHNGKAGIEHGAYRNGYEYLNLELFGNGRAAVVQHAASGGDVYRPDGYSLVFENLASDGPLLLVKQNLPSNRPVLYRNCRFTAVEVDNAASAGPPLYDFVDCGLAPEQFTVTSATPGTTIRVQDGDDAYLVDDTGTVSPIEPFATG
ncbi:MAG: hypothetical protein ACK5PP_01110 [Acidimicrobiales bacterium]